MTVYFLLVYEHTVNYRLCVLFQVSDVEEILGIVHTENIQVTVEAYDIILDLSPGRYTHSLYYFRTQISH